jgi:hypothetical protein
MFNIIKLDDGREWLTDGHTGIACDSAIRLLGIMQEIAACNCEASIVNGVLWLEDGTTYDVQKLVEEAKK